MITQGQRSRAAIGRLRAVASAAALSLLLSGCRQDLILKEANGLKASATMLADAQGRLRTALPDSCRRKAALRDLASEGLRTREAVNDYVASAVAHADTGKSCLSAERKELIELLTLHTKVLVDYSALLERAATHQEVKLQAGTLLEDLQKNALVKNIPGFVTKDVVDQVVNGVVDLIVNHARAGAIKEAVRTADPLVQSLSAEFVRTFGTDDVCDPAAVVAAKAPQWCLVFDGELELIKQRYGDLAVAAWPYRAERVQVDPPLLRRQFEAKLAAAKRTGDFKPAGDAYVALIAQIRARTQRGADLRSLALFERLTAAARSAARRRDAVTLAELFDNALATLRSAAGIQNGAGNDSLATRLDASLKSYKSAIAAGSDYAKGARDFAAGHARLLTLIKEPVPANTAVFDR